MWASIQVRLVACTGADGFRADPERTRSVALMVAGLTFPEKVTVISVGAAGDGDGLAVGLELAGDRYQRGGDDAEGTADGDAAGAVELEGPDVARPVAGQAQAAAGDLDLGVARKSVGIAVASQALSIAAEAAVNWKSASRKKLAGPSEPGLGSIGKTKAGLPTKLPWLSVAACGCRSQRGGAEAVPHGVDDVGLRGLAGAVARRTGCSAA